MVLLYAGEKGCTLRKFFREDLQRTLPPNMKAKIIYTGNELSS